MLDKLVRKWRAVKQGKTPAVKDAMRVYNVLNLGAGWQSSLLFLKSCRGELPKFDAAVFADTQWEPKAVYATVAFLQEQGQKAGIPLAVVSRGDLRQDAIDFRRARRSLGGRPCDVKRYASIPLFVKNLDGSQGRIKRQCTKEYKIEVVDRWIRRVLLELAPRRRIPKEVVVRQWFGISDDEASRAVFPGRYKEVGKTIMNLFGDPVIITSKQWVPSQRRQHVYPLLNQIWLPDRTILDYPFFERRMQRSDVGAWLREHYPERTFPRSACIGCPFRSNEEWRDMRDNRPDEWMDACNFDDAQREADRVGPGRRGMLVGQPFVHRQLVPLRMADLGGLGEKGGGCGTLYDGQDGLCGV